jgi:hypothetical protein
MSVASPEEEFTGRRLPILGLEMPGERLMPHGHTPAAAVVRTRGLRVPITDTHQAQGPTTHTLAVQWAVRRVALAAAAMWAVETSAVVHPTLGVGATWVGVADTSAAEALPSVAVAATSVEVAALPLALADTANSRTSQTEGSLR